MNRTTIRMAVLGLLLIGRSAAADPLPMETAKQSPIIVSIARVIESRAVVPKGSDAPLPTNGNTVYVFLRFKGPDIASSTQFGRLKLDQVEDDLGNRLTVITKINSQGDGFVPLYWPRRNRKNGTGPRNECDVFIIMASTSRKATRLKSFSGELTFLVTEVAKASIPFEKIPEKKAGDLPELKDVGLNAYIVRRQTSKAGTSVELRLSGQNLFKIVDFHLADKDGKWLLSPLTLSGVRAMFGTHDKFPKDAQLVVAVQKTGAKTRLRTVKFNFKDVPLP